MATLLSLLERGYFPRELPPPFNTSTFASYAVTAGATWPKAEWTCCGAHNLARPGDLRRPLKIPNPLSYFVLAEVISTNYNSIKQHTWRRRLSVSKPHVMKNSPRAIVPRYRYGELPRLRVVRRRGTRYLLRTDISQFYPAIYTHAIPWALHTKTACKTALKTASRGANLLGNRIDKALQCMNEGQTHGIPIGPDTSLVAAEILLAAIDDALLKKCPSLVSGFRYVDDYELSFAKLSDAEQVLNELQGILASFELSLNPRKTGIQHLPKALEDTWAADLRRFPIRDTGAVAQRNDLVAFFSRAFELASDHPEDPVLGYAIARVQNLVVHGGSWRTFQSCVLSAAATDSSTMATVLNTLYRVSVRGGHAISKSPLEETFERVIERHALLGEGSEVAWSLWGALAWSVSLSSRAARSVSAMDDNIVALLALDADGRGLFPGGSLNRQKWTTLVNEPNVLHTEHWLLAYEAHQKNWLPTPTILPQPHFHAMGQAGVSFYDPAQASAQSPSAAQPMPGGSLTDYYA